MSQIPSPQPPQGPQSAPQVLQSSPAETWQKPSPQVPQTPQSEGQVAHHSPIPGSHWESPQAAPPHPPWQAVLQAATQPASQDTAQQYGSRAHTQDSQPQPPQPGPSWGTQGSPAGQGPQSAGQDWQCSPSATRQSPSPQAEGQGPQSASQVTQLSPSADLHRPSPQPPQLPQSSGQLWQCSPSVGSQLPSPQLRAQAWPQASQRSTQVSSHSTVQQKGSCEHTQARQPQEAQPGVTVGEQPSPPVQAPQSRVQLQQFSPAGPLQAPSPQVTGQGPQSAGQLEQLSDWPQVPSPQLPAQAPPQGAKHSDTQPASQGEVQQKGSSAHTQDSQSQPPQPGVCSSWHPSPPPWQAWQSEGQLWQCSPRSGSQTPSPQ